jgi:hypothetical protein
MERLGHPPETTFSRLRCRSEPRAVTAPGSCEQARPLTGLLIYMLVVEFWVVSPFPPLTLVAHRQTQCDAEGWKAGWTGMARCDGRFPLRRVRPAADVANQLI